MKRCVPWHRVAALCSVLYFQAVMFSITVVVHFFEFKCSQPQLCSVRAGTMHHAERSALIMLSIPAGMFTTARGGKMNKGVKTTPKSPLSHLYNNIKRLMLCLICLDVFDSY